MAPWNANQLELSTLEHDTEVKSASLSSLCLKIEETLCPTISADVDRLIAAILVG